MFIESEYQTRTPPKNSENFYRHRAISSPHSPVPIASGSTIADAQTVGYRSIGIDIDRDYFHLAEASIPKLAALYPAFEGDQLEFDSSDYPQEAVEEGQLTMALAEEPARYRVQECSLLAADCCLLPFDQLAGGTGWGIARRGWKPLPIPFAAFGPI